MDSRQYGKKFPGCLKETARPSPFLALVFFVDMMKHSRSLTTLFILGLCMAGLLALAFSPVAGLPLVEVFEVEFESEFEDDTLLMNACSSELGGLNFAHVDFQSMACSPSRTIPDSPPPKTV